MVPNKLLERLRKGEKGLGVHLTFPNDEIVEICGHLGLDFIYFEGQHAPMTTEAVARMCRLADGFGVTPTMRVPDQQESTILSYLDCGIKAVVVPMVDTKAQAEALVQACFYAPLGRRSYTSLRMMEYDFQVDPKALMARANANTMLIPQIETITAVNNLDEILTIDGIECFAPGPNDLAQSMGFPGEPDHPECLEAQQRAEDKIAAAGKKMWSDIAEMVGEASTVRAAAIDLLRRYGRT